MSQETGKPTRKIFYGWWIVAAGTIINTLNGGLYFYGFSNFFMPLVKEFGWSRTAVSLGTSLSRLEAALEAPLVGFLIDKFGPRKVMLFGLSLMGIGFLLFSRITSFGMYLAVFLGCLAIGQGFGIYVPIHTTAANWFVKKRSRVMGILQSGVGAGGILVPVFALIITRYGWRAGAITGGAVLLAIGLPLAMLFKHRPEQYGYKPDGESVEVSGAPVTMLAKGMTKGLEEEVHFTPKEAMKTAAFWSIAIASGITQGVSSSIVLHSIPYLTDIGIPTMVAASATGSIGVTSIFGRLSFGWLGDRWDKRHLLVFAFVLEALGVLIFSNVRSTWHLIPFLALFCLGYGGVQPLILAILGDFFGRKSYGTVFGFQQVFRTLIQMALPIAAAWIFDTTGSYLVAFMSFIALLVIAGALMLITKPSRKCS